uniref:RING-type domain-containing protein n=2 Tax=Macrostomum lignano TaxID=282301 RepID=A0A1I8H1W4_9PLAT
TQPPPKSPLSRKRRSHQINDSPSAQRTSPKPASPGPSLRRSKRRCVVLGSFQSRLDSTRQCSLCAEALTGELASPESCPGHNFHLICLNNWLDLQQKSGAGPRRLACPMEACKRAFTTIFIRREVGGKVIQQLPADRSFACPICQETIVGECASPDCCDHSYCPACLRQWSRSSATCPLDRLPPLRRHATVDSAGVAAATADESSPALPLDVNSLLGYLRFMSIRRLADGDFYGYCFYSSLLRII